MQIDLLLKDIQDPAVRENFFRLKQFIESQTILDGFFKFFEFEFPTAGTFDVKHNLNFIPRDIINLSVEGDKYIYFENENFTEQTIRITVRGACRVRFLAGNYRDKGYGGSKTDFTLVAP